MKLEYFAATLLDSDFRAALFPSYEYALSVELPQIALTTQRKANDNYEASFFKTSSYEYHDNGFIEEYPVAVEDFPAFTPVKFSAELVVKENMDYLTKLIDLCRENGITFIAYSSPQATPVLKQYSESFEAGWDYFEEFFEKQDVPYYNFNRDYYDAYSHNLTNDVDFNGHMNGESAIAFSRVLGDVLGLE